MNNPDRAKEISRRAFRVRMSRIKADPELEAAYREIRRKERYEGHGYPVPTREMPPTCELCSAAPRTRALHLDHDHVTGKFRGWLCAKCNTGIGKLGDNVEGLRRAIAYLERAV